MTAKFIIRWNVGYGDNVEVVEAENLAAAQDAAYEAAREDFESNADYGAMPFTPDLAEKFGVEQAA